MLIKTARFVAGLMVILTAAGVAHAQYPGTEARAYTSGMPGAYNNYSGYLSGVNPATATADPAEAVWDNTHGLLRGDAFATTTAALGRITSSTFSIAERLTATAFNNNVSSSTYGQYYERLKVESATLAAGTPVTLVFRHDVSADWTGTGLFSGSVDASLTIAGVSTRSQWSVKNDTAVPELSTGTVTVNTRVGAVLYVHGKLTARSTGIFFTPGPRYSGSLEINAESAWHLEQAPGDVAVRTETGTLVYPQP